MCLVQPRNSILHFIYLKKIVFPFNYFKLRLVATGYCIGSHSVELSDSQICLCLTGSYCFLDLVQCSFLTPEDA